MNVLIIALSNLGDSILTVPAIQAVREKFPEARFDVLAGPKTEEFFKGDPGFRKVFIWKKKIPLWSQVGLVLRLMAGGYRLVIDFKNTLIPFFLVGAKRTPFRRAFLKEFPHRIDQHLALVKAIGIPPPKEPPRLFFSPEDERKAEEWLRSLGPDGSDGLVVAVVPGAKSHLKRWAPEKFASVADRLAVEREAKILLIGGLEDRGETFAVKQRMHYPALDLAGHTSLKEVAALLARTDLVITNDTANLHAAQITGVPTVAIFGPTDERKYGPKNPNSAVIRKRLICAPCEKALCQYHHECMKWLEAKEVYAAAVKLLR
ncbi:MAG: glycosyltransferase family 9 protein [Candidatus Omnitrophica bacterium]|nr:glycosyltransferase family 9 protein [Candidatus Omnitrophota bacterium]